MRCLVLRIWVAWQKRGSGFLLLTIFGNDSDRIAWQESYPNNSIMADCLVRFSSASRNAVRQAGSSRRHDLVHVRSDLRLGVYCSILSDFVGELRRRL